MIAGVKPLATGLMMAPHRLGNRSMIMLALHELIGAHVIPFNPALIAAGTHDPAKCDGAVISSAPGADQ
jgi:hypothetical protein